MSLVHAAAAVAIVLLQVSCSDLPLEPGSQLRARLEVSPASIAQGDSIRMQLLVANVGKSTVSLECPRSDFEAYGSDGRPLYRTTDYPGLAVCNGTVTIGPGQMAKLVDYWLPVRDRDTVHKPAPADSYSIRGRVTSLTTREVYSPFVRFVISE